LFVCFFAKIESVEILVWKSKLRKALRLCIAFGFTKNSYHFSENPLSPHKHVYFKKRNLKIICEITHATGKYLQGLVGPAISKESFKSTKKTVYHLIRLATESSKIFVSFP